MTNTAQKEVWINSGGQGYTFEVWIGARRVGYVTAMNMSEASSRAREALGPNATCQWYGG